MNPLIKITLLLLSTFFSYIVNANDRLYGAGIGGVFYDTFEGESKPFIGKSIYLTWKEEASSNRLTLRDSSHGLQVATNLSEREVQRNWDLEYNLIKQLNSSKIVALYYAPIIGIKLKEELSVICKYTNKVCFDTYIEDWKIKDTNQRFLPLAGVSAGITVMPLNFVIDTNLFVKTDFEDSYYGIEFSIGGQQVE